MFCRLAFQVCGLYPLSLSVALMNDGINDNDIDMERENRKIRGGFRITSTELTNSEAIAKMAAKNAVLKTDDMKMIIGLSDETKSLIVAINSKEKKI